MSKTHETGQNPPHTGIGSMPLYNLGGLKKMADNDDEFLRQTLGIFIQNSEKASEDLSGSLRDNDWKRMGEIAHKILPSCRHLEINSVVTRLIELKSKTLYSTEPCAPPSLVLEIIEELGKVSESLKQEIRL
jgi:HPt (histidine-containing phosphotransfer) domain-containing protein